MVNYQRQSTGASKENIHVLLNSHEQGTEITTQRVNGLLLAPTRSLKRLQTNMTAQSLLLEP